MDSRSGTDILNEYLMHYGVKGMKWGIRRTPTQLGHKPSGSKRKTSAKKSKKPSGLLKKKVKTKKVTRRKKASEFTDEELSRAVKRLQLEKQYMDLVNSVDGQSNSKRGSKFIKNSMDKVVVPAVQEAGKEILKQAIKDAATKRRRSS